MGEDDRQHPPDRALAAIAVDDAARLGVAGHLVDRLERRRPLVVAVLVQVLEVGVCNRRHLSFSCSRGVHRLVEATQRTGRLGGDVGVEVLEHGAERAVGPVIGGVEHGSALGGEHGARRGGGRRHRGGARPGRVHEAVDQPGDAGPAHVEPVGEHRRGPVALAQERQRSVLGEGQIVVAEGVLDDAGEPGEDVVGLPVTLVGTTVRLPELLGPHHLQVSVTMKVCTMWSSTATSASLASWTTASTMNPPSGGAAAMPIVAA